MPCTHSILLLPPYTSIIRFFLIPYIAFSNPYIACTVSRTLNILKFRVLYVFMKSWTDTRHRFTLESLTELETWRKTLHIRVRQLRLNVADVF